MKTKRRFHGITTVFRSQYFLIFCKRLPLLWSFCFSHIIFISFIFKEKSEKNP